MTNNKKGLMLKFLTTLILALIIFIPACMFVSKFFRISQQAEGNFLEFVGEIKQLGENKQLNPYEGSTVLILDKDTFVINVWAKYNKGFTRCTSFYEEQWALPSNACPQGDCICLIQDFKVDETYEEGKVCGKSGSDTVQINKIAVTKLNCQQIPKEYYVYGLDWREWNRFSDSAPRRITMGLIKKDNTIFVCKNPPCTIPSTLEKHE